MSQPNMTTPHQPPSTEELEERFWSKVDKSGDCWVWKGVKGRNGYGAFWNGLKLVRAHRWIFFELNPRVDRSLLVCHHCDNPSCVRPDHLFQGTHGDNAKDMAAKKRNFIPRYCGERHGRAKLTLEIVNEIRSRTFVRGQVTALAKSLGINTSLIGQIRRREIWKDAAPVQAREGKQALNPSEDGGK